MGVAANALLREALAAACAERALTFHPAKPAYCTDNAAMIAARGFQQFHHGETDGLDLNAYPTAGPRGPAHRRTCVTDQA